MTRHTFRSAEALGDWLGLGYRGLLYALAATPIWGAALALYIVFGAVGRY